MNELAGRLRCPISDTNNLMKDIFAGLTRELHVDRSAHVNLILNLTQYSLRYQKLRLRFFIGPLNPARNVHRISNGSNPLLQTTSYGANDCFAKV